MTALQLELKARDRYFRTLHDIDDVGITQTPPPLPEYRKEKVKWSKTAVWGFISQIMP